MSPERIANLANELDQLFRQRHTAKDVEAIIKQAITETRTETIEKCAKACEDESGAQIRNEYDRGWDDACLICAQSVRAVRAQAIRALK